MVGVGIESLGGGDGVFVDDAEGAEAHVVGVPVLAEGEGVVGVEPAVVEVAAIGGSSDGDHGRAPGG